MQVNVTGKQIDITEALQQYADKKCVRLDRYYDRVKSVDVLIDKPNHEFEVEIVSHVDGHDPFISSCRGDDVYACIDESVDKLSRQLSDHKEKIRNHKHG